MDEQIVAFRRSRSGQARPGQARPGQARPGQARPGQDVVLVAVVLEGLFYAQISEAINSRVQLTRLVVEELGGCLDVFTTRLYQSQVFSPCVNISTVWHLPMPSCLG